MRLAVVARRTLGVVLAVAVAAAVWTLQTRQDRPARPVAAPVGALAWPFQGSASVASARQTTAAYTMAPAIASYVARARTRGQRVAVGQPRALFAAHYAPGAIDVVVELAPVTGAGDVIALAGLYSADQSHQGTESVAVVHAGDQAISGDVESYLFKAEHPVTVVIGGPRAGGILVNVDGGNTGPNGLPGAQVSSDPRGIAWIYDAVPRTLAAPTNGVISVTDGNGDYQHLLYYGPPAATPTHLPPSSLGWAL